MKARNGKRLKSLQSYKDEDLIGKTAYRVYKHKIVEFKITGVTRAYVKVSINGKASSYKKDSCYLTLEDAKIRQLRLNLKFLKENGLNIMEYHKVLDNIITEFPEYLI